MWWILIILTGVLFGALAWMVPNLIWLMTWLIAKWCFSFRIPYAPFGWTALALVLIVWLCLAYGHFIGRFNIEVNEVEYASADVPEAFDGYRVVHISDFHADSFKDTKELQKVIDKVNEQHADIILFTGDMCTVSMKGMQKHESALKRLKAEKGVVSVMGNHDFFIYNRAYHSDRERSAAAESLAEYERTKLGWRVLRNDSYIINKGNDSIAIAGVDNINGGQGFRTIQKGDLKKAMTGLDGTFTILMTHDPSHWKAEVLPKSHAQITLSGHTHAAQIRIFGWSLANLLFNECDGRYDHDGRMLYVNAGIGCTTPFRIGCPSEITVITLRHK